MPKNYKDREFAISTMKDSHKAAAMCIAKGMSKTATAKELGYTLQWIQRISKFPGFKEYVKEMQRDIRDGIVDNAARLEKKFNNEANEAFKTLQSLHRGKSNDPLNPVPHAVRRGAAKDILEHSTDVPNPKAERELEKLRGDQHLHIHIPKRHFDNFDSAMEDIREIEGEVVEE